MTQQQGLTLLGADARDAVGAVRRHVRGLAQHEFDALVSFTFNLGEGNPPNSTLLRRVNSGLLSRQLGAIEFRRWIYASGLQLRGLVNRRQAEADLYLNGNYGTGP